MDNTKVVREILSIAKGLSEAKKYSIAAKNSIGWAASNSMKAFWKTFDKELDNIRSIAKEHTNKNIFDLISADDIEKEIMDVIKSEISQRLKRIIQK